MWDDDGIVFDVLINDEGQYSIWPTSISRPDGWREVGKSGPKADCLTFIEQAWTDMRPLSLVRAMAETPA
jgi:MbtH protein